MILNYNSCPEAKTVQLGLQYIDKIAEKIFGTAIK